MSLQFFGQRYRLLLANVCVLAVFFQCVRDSGALPPDSDGRRTRRRSHGLTRIIGGKGCNIHQHPYMVSFVKHSSGEHYCGGALIGWKAVLSASHCFENEKKRLLDSVKAGISFTNEKAPQEEQIFTIHKHPKFDANTLENDIAVIKLKGQFHSAAEVRLIKLPPPPTKDIGGKTEPDCNQVFTMGWGSTEPQKQRRKRKKRHTRQLRCVNLPVVKSGACKMHLSHTSWITNQVICTRQDDGSGDTCGGDSGGPLICANRGNNTIGLGHVDTVFGVISSGYGCGQPDTPALNTRVDRYLAFINKGVNPASRCGSTPPISAVILSNLSIVVCYMLMLPAI